MTDLRQGVTPTQHDVLDMVDSRAAKWSFEMDFKTQLNIAHGAAYSACDPTWSLPEKRAAAIEAAARLIVAAEEMGRVIAQGGAA